MSGPIIRKYGFPNFEKIFGERDLKHGADPAAATPPPAPAPAPPSQPADPPEAPRTAPEPSRP